MAFNRHVRAEESSWAYWQFNEYETQVNDLYWSGYASLSFASHTVRNLKPPLTARGALKATGSDAKRIRTEPAEFIKHHEEFQNWSCASFVMAATGALESYFQRIVLTALLSDPAVIYGKSKAIDGLVWLKIGIKADHSKTLESVTKGEWTQRYASIKRLFGEIPDLQTHVSELDKIREFRNGVGHAFGRTLVDEPDLTTRQTEKMQSIRQAKFKSWLEVISKSAKALDLVLVKNHIGDFEPLMHFHAYLAQLNSGSVPHDRDFINRYRKSLGKAEVHSKGYDYCRGLVEAYDLAS